MPANPHIYPMNATMHDDALCSDTTAQSGTAATTGDLTSTFLDMNLVCATLLGGSPLGNSDGEGGLWVIGAQAPKLNKSYVALVDTRSDPMSEQDRFELENMSPLGSVYPYLDDQNRVVVIDKDREIKFLGWEFDNNTNARKIKVVERHDVSSIMEDGDPCMGLVPDDAGNIWCATKAGHACFFNPSDGTMSSVQLNAVNSSGENVSNSPAACPNGLAVATNYGMYFVVRDGDTARVGWHYEYNRGDHRKPGQLYQGTGSTPTFFGPTTGYEFVTISDNRTHYNTNPQNLTFNVLVFRVSDGTWVKKAARFGSKTQTACEVSPIGHGGAAIYTNTWGYAYPALATDGSVSDPVSATFAGGIEQFDVSDDGTTLSISDEGVASNEGLACTSVPKLSTTDNVIYTFYTNFQQNQQLVYFGEYAADTGTQRDNLFIGTKSGIFDPNETMGFALILVDGVVYQGSMTGIFKIERTSQGSA